MTLSHECDLRLNQSSLGFVGCHDSLFFEGYDSSPGLSAFSGIESAVSDDLWNGCVFLCVLWSVILQFDKNNLFSVRTRDYDQSNVQRLVRLVGQVAAARI